MKIKIRHYHTNNVIFKAKRWLNDCYQKGKSITYAGVNAHHQNSIAEIRIRWLQELVWTTITHANIRWQGPIKANIWLYTLRVANNAIKNAPNMAYRRRRTPEQIYTKTIVHANPRHTALFGCLAYVLEEELQQGHPFHKWKQRERVGIYLG